MQRCSGDHGVADGLERNLRQPRREKAGGDRVDRDAVLPPLAGQRAGKVDQAPLGGVVGQGFVTDRVAAQSGDRRHIEDPAIAAGNHRVAPDRLRQQEHPGQVQVDQLLPAVQRVRLGRRRPGGTGVVDQDVDVPQLCHRRSRELRHRVGLAHVGRQHLDLDARGGQVGAGLLQFIGLAGGDQDLGAELAQRLGDLQTQSARTACHDRLATAQIHHRLQRHDSLSMASAAMRGPVDGPAHRTRQAIR